MCLLAFQQVFNVPRMSLGKNIRARREALGWTLEDLADRSGVELGTISALEVRGSTRSKFAGALAAALGVTVDQLLSDGTITSVPVPRPRTVASRVPVAGYAQLGDNGWYEEVQMLGSEGYVETHSSDPDAYALKVRGDSMFPAIRDGWYVVVEPNGTASAGEYVAIALQDGRKMVKEFLFGNGESISVQSVNGGTRLTLSAQEILAVHPIGAVLMPSKHREV